jgi:hypothetical protein
MHAVVVEGSLQLDWVFIDWRVVLVEAAFLAGGDICTMPFGVF